jgi:carbamoyl-phosphate synthase large subunit
MKSVGEAMSIGRTFKEAFQKGIRSMETKVYGLRDMGGVEDRNAIKEKLSRPNAERIFYIKTAFKAGFTLDEICDLTMIDRWFLHNMKEIIEMEDEIKKSGGKSIPADVLFEAKRNGFSDIYLAELLGLKENDVYKMRKDNGIKAVYKLVDTCGAEFQAYTPYYYSTYEIEDESRA